MKRFTVLFFLIFSFNLNAITNNCSQIDDESSCNSSSLGCHWDESASPKHCLDGIASNNPILSISPITKSVYESAGSVSVEITLSERPNIEQIQISYATADNSAISGVDYISTEGNLIFSTGSDETITSVINIPIIDNGAVNSDINFTITIVDNSTDPTQHFTINNSTTTVIILDDDSGTQPVPDSEVIPSDSSIVNETCGVFEDGLQTTNPGSDIDMSGGGGSESYLYNNPDNSLNTFDVESKQTGWWVVSYDDTCKNIAGNSGNDETCEDSGVAATKITDITMLYPTSYTLATPITSSVEDINCSPTQPTLELSEYNEIISEWNSGTVTNINFSVLNRLYVNSLDTSGAESANVLFSSTGTDLYSATVGAFNVARTTVTTDSYAQNIYINTLSASDAHNSVSLSASQTIKIENLTTSHTSSYLLEAQYININSLNDISGVSQENSITLRASYIDIDTLDIGDATTLNIEPLTEGQGVVVKINSLTTGSNNILNFSKGTYYIKTLVTSGSGNGYQWNVDGRVNLILEDSWNSDSAIAINADEIGGANLCDDSHDALDLFIYSYSDINTANNTRIVATIYTEGDFLLSSSSYVKGAITSGDNITLNNGSEVCYQQDLNTSGWGECAIGNSYQNSYTCGIYPSVLTSYQLIGAQKNDVINTCFISTPVFEQLHASAEQNLTCMDNGELCNGDGTCTVIPEPINRYEYDILTSDDSSSNTSTSDIELNDVNQPNWSFENGISVHFNPTGTYTDSTKPLMKLGVVEHSGNNADITFEEGDYFFQSWTLLGNGINIHTNGAVRIFIEEDFTFPGNSIEFFRAEGSTVFAYMKNDFIMSSVGGGTNRLEAFFYVEGDVEIENNSKAAEIFGGITAEGDLIINGNNINFIYDEDGATSLGLGECKLCYDKDYIRTEGIFGMCMPMFFTCQLDLPIRNIDSNELNDVVVTETYKSSMSMSFPMGSTYKTLDKVGNEMGNGAYSQDSTDYSIFALDISLNSKSNVYDFGDNYPAYYNTNGDYNRAFKKITMSMDFDFSSWGDNVVYLGEYTDFEDRDYHVRLDECSYISAANGYEPGLIDAVDTTCNTLESCKDTNISTKVSGRAYDLNILDINNSSNSSFGVALIDNSDFNSYYIGEVNATDNGGITTFAQENLTNWAFYSDKFASKDVWLQFYFCNSNTNWNSCWSLNGNTLVKLTGDANESSSKDKFSIRPKSYEVALHVEDVMKLKAGESYTIDVNATYDLNSSSVEGYTKILSGLSDSNASKSLNPSSSLCTLTDSENFNANFVNGNYSDNNFTFDNVGDINISFFDSNWTEIDQANGGCTLNSTSTTTTPVGCNIESIKQVRFTPHHFGVTGTLDNSGNGFTYYASDLNHSASLNMVITAQTQADATTSYYTKNCYAKDVNITMNSDESGIIYGIDSTPTNPTQLSEGNFSDGNATIALHVNFGREKNVVKNPIQPDINVSVKEEDDADINGTLQITSQAKFLYGRVHVPRQRIIGDSAVSIPLYYEVYCGEECSNDANIKALIPSSQLGQDSIYWYDITSLHVVADGNISSITEDNEVFFSGSNGELTDSKSVTYHYNGEKSYPYRRAIVFEPSNWLIYNKYNANATDDDFVVEFQYVKESSSVVPYVDDGESVIRSHRRLIW
ncbi:MAG: Calx-beta domain-containing protein [Campylobacterota bacterium]|nr:Calx-beta domain-containing protein [Campylobacterota bacterium]